MDNADPLIKPIKFCVILRPHLPLPSDGAVTVWLQMWQMVPLMLLHLVTSWSCDWWTWHVF